MNNLNIILQGGAPQGNPSMTWIMLGMMVLVFYFFMIRPQQKKVKTQKLFIEGLKKGDNIITTGGIHGKVINIENTTIVIDSEGTRLRLEKSAISSDLSVALNAAANKNAQDKA
jgi:preprotein translocase subunit YajC